MSYYSTIPCSEEFGTRKESVALEGGWTCSVTLRCRYEYRYALAGDLLYNRRLWPYSITPKGPRAKTIAIRVVNPNGNSPISQTMLYEDALLDINYDTTTGDGTDLVSESIEPRAEFVTLDHRNFRWESGDGEPLTEQQAPGKIVRQLHLVRTYYQLPRIPAVVLSGVGNVHFAPYNSKLLGISFPAETLMLGQPDIKRTIRTDGTDGYTLTLKWSYQPSGWNKFPQADGTYAEIYEAGADEPFKPYTPENLTEILG